MRLKTLWVGPTLVLGLSLPCLMDCSDAADLASGCDELNGGAEAVAKLDVDAKLKTFITATADLKTIADRIKADVKTACVGMSTSLGLMDTWTALGDSDDAISNPNKTGACDQASVKIQAIMAANPSANATLIVSGGQCTVDANLQAMCEATCKSDVMCTEPDITVRCEPGQLTGECSANCNANAFCEGSAMVAANCMGACEAECQGTCNGSCTGTITGGCSGTCEGKCDGVATPAGGMANCTGTCEGKCSMPAATASCRGKCAASCNGKCTGNCKLDSTAMVNCGAMVNCKGGCSVMYTAPKCETELTPAMCSGDVSCQGSCTSRAEVNATCTPPSAQFIFTTSSPDLDLLKAALEANMPKIWLAFKTEGPLAVKAAAHVVTAGTAAAQAAGSFGGKAVACATASVTAAASASASVNVSFQASASVSGSAGAS